jgi:glucosamine-6-phosphate deaminase
LSNRENVSWKNVWTFNMDEFLDWEGRPLRQFHSSMEANLFTRLKADLNVPEEQRWFPDPFNPDAIDEKIDEMGGIDVAYGGMGEHGHLAFNEPVTTYSYYTHLTPEQFKGSKSRVVEMNPETLTRGLNAPSFQFPPRAVTLGMRVILEAKKIVLVGGGRVPIFRIACMHPPSMDFPVTYIQEHPNPKETVTVYVSAHDPYAPYPPRAQVPAQ